MILEFDFERLTRTLETRERQPLTIPGFRHAAVLVPIELTPSPRLILTVRSSHLPTHKGQISFPGGSLDPGETPEAGALREALEEVGLEPTLVRVLGLLDDVWTPAGFYATPVVGVFEPGAALLGDPGEVAEILHVPISDLKALEPRFETRILPSEVISRIPGASARREVLHYDWKGYDIWGMTGWVIERLLGLLE